MGTAVAAKFDDKKWRNFYTLKEKTDKDDKHIGTFLKEITNLMDNYHKAVRKNPNINKDSNGTLKKARLGGDFCNTYIDIDNLLAKAIRLDVGELSKEMKEQCEEGDKGKKEESKAMKRVVSDNRDYCLRIVGNFYCTLRQFVVCNRFIYDLVSEIRTLSEIGEAFFNTEKWKINIKDEEKKNWEDYRKSRKETVDEAKEIISNYNKLDGRRDYDTFVGSDDKYIYGRGEKYWDKEK